jgi:hypothetical protein
MRGGIAVATLFGAALLGVPSVAHASGADVVQVKGRTFRGTAVETRPGVLVRLRLDDSTEVTVLWSEVVSIDGEPLPPATSVKPGPKPAQPDLPRHWYGWQTLLVDAGSVVLLPLAGVGIVTYAVGPSIVHAAHGRAGPALGSILLRVSMPLVLAVVGVGIGDAATPSNQNYNGVAPAPILGGLTGLVLGVLGAMAIDDAVFAWEPVKPSPAAAGLGASPSITIVPRITLTGDAEHGHARWMGIGGSF